jgi:outer membrane protein
MLMPCLLLGARAAAQPATPPPPQTQTQVAAPASAAQDRFEGAIGLVLNEQPTFSGSSEFKLKPQLAGFLRYGRYTLTGAGGFTTRRDDEVERGLDAELVRRERLRLSMALRFDGGRSQAADPALNGLGDIRRTVRSRLSATWRVDEVWRLGAAWSTDLLGRGGGGFGDLNFAHEHKSSPDTTWSWGASLSLADGRWMRNYFGVDAVQSAASGYPMFEVGSGLRDVAVFGNVRHELSTRWLVLGGVSASRLVADAASSPLTKQPLGWGVNGALAWRF